MYVSVCVCVCVCVCVRVCVCVCEVKYFHELRILLYLHYKWNFWGSRWMRNENADVTGPDTGLDTRSVRYNNRKMREDKRLLGSVCSITMRALSFLALVLSWRGKHAGENQHLLPSLYLSIHSSIYPSIFHSISCFSLSFLPTFLLRPVSLSAIRFSARLPRQGIK